MDTDVQNYVSSHCHEQGYAGRIEVVTGPSGRRRWPEHVKAAMVLETFRDGVSVADVARKHGVSAPQLDTRKNPLSFGSAGAPDALVAGSVSDRSDPGWLRAVSRDCGQTHPLIAWRSWKIRRSML